MSFFYETPASNGDPPGGADALAFAREMLKFEPDEQQARLLATDASQVILNCTRQWGKSRVAAARAVWHAYTGANRLVLVVSKSKRQSRLFVRKAAEFLKELGIDRERWEGEEISVGLPNGSGIVGICSREDTCRGFSAVTMLVIDEASRVPDDMFEAVLPMLATTDGCVWILSTPNGKRGFFWEIWAKGGPGWLRISVPASECPRIRPEFLEKIRALQGADYMRQEYGCEFLSGSEYLFDRDEFEAIFTPDVKELGW